MINDSNYDVDSSNIISNSDEVLQRVRPAAASEGHLTTSITCSFSYDYYYY